ncbi:3-isopropylmalate dehydrogenase [miscellaneous Crenarchaeota group archaeon SMTZ-80]|nr:MAG: 3-isopropylmalate dehydrogenase [miscellaneous Crenarchaeota group archaeon SMTZ-80]
MSKKTYKIAIIGGDGTGPEVVNEGLKVLKTVAAQQGFAYETISYDIGGERYRRTGEILPDSIFQELKKVDAIYLGAIGDPNIKPGILEKGILLRIRFEMDQYVNLRPVVLYDPRFCPLKDKTEDDIDFIVVRENTEGLYCGAGGFLKKGTKDEIAIQESINSYKGVERVIRFAFDYARRRNKRKKVTLCGKTNVLTYAFDLWERVFYEVAEEYSDIEADYANVDAVCMWMVKSPEWFDVIVTNNMFGDIITDLGAMIQGGMGIAAGGNINPNGVSMFEPIGGSAPKYTGKNVINPLAAICALSMLLDMIGEQQAAYKVEKTVKTVVKDKLQSLSAGKMGYSTSEVGDLIVEYLSKNSN